MSEYLHPLEEDGTISQPSKVVNDEVKQGPLDEQADIHERGNMVNDGSIDMYCTIDEPNDEYTGIYSDVSKTYTSYTSLNNEPYLVPDIAVQRGDKIEAIAMVPRKITNEPVGAVDSHSGYTPLNNNPNILPDPQIPYKAKNEAIGLETKQMSNEPVGVVDSHSGYTSLNNNPNILSDPQIPYKAENEAIGLETKQMSNEPVGAVDSHSGYTSLIE